MSERYHRIGPRFWADSAGWSEDARMLALYLLTCEHRRTEGLYRLPKPYILGDLNWPPERLTQPFEELLSVGFISYDESAAVVLIRKALKWQAPENPNQATSAVNKIAELPETALLSDLLLLAEEHCQRLAKALKERFPERLGQPQAQAQALPQAQNDDDARTRESDPPDHLTEVFAALERVAFARSLSSPKVEATQRACGEFADRDLDAEAEKFAHYWIDGPGEKRDLTDVAWTWRNWLERAKPADPKASAPADFSKYDRKVKRGAAA